MNFPMQYPVFQFLYWLVNTAGLGGWIVTGLASGVVFTLAVTLHWIKRGASSEESETFAYPTPALLKDKGEG